MIVIHEASHARLNQIANLFLESDLDDPVSKVGTIVGHQELNRASVGREERPFARHFEPCFQLLLRKQPQPGVMVGTLLHLDIALTHRGDIAPGEVGPLQDAAALIALSITVSFGDLARIALERNRDEEARLFILTCSEVEKPKNTSESSNSLMPMIEPLHSYPQCRHRCEKTNNTAFHDSANKDFEQALV